MDAPDESIHNAHDKLFRTGFGNPATAAGFLSAELPAPVAAMIDWSQLRVESPTFVDSAFRRSECDLLFSAPAGTHGECLIYLLFEHQVNLDPLLPLRLLRYMVRIWETCARDHSQSSRFPAIVPVVLAQNSRQWNLSPNFANLVELPSHEFSQFIPSFCFRLIELATIPFEAIRGTPAGIMILRTLKAERLSLLLADPVWDEPLLIQVPPEIRELIIRYMLATDLDYAAFERRD